MPIVIAQPDMVSPQISTGYGAAEEWDKWAPHMVAQQEAISRANIASAQIQSQASQAAAALQQHGQMFSAQQQAQQREQQYAGEQAITQQAYGIQGQLQQQQQHAELAAWVNSQEMTQADNLRLQRLNQSLSAVQEGVASGQYTPQEAMDLTMQLRTGIDPLQQRLKQQQVKQEAMQTKAIEQKMAQQKTAQIENEKFEADLKEKGYGVLKMVDPNTGQVHTLIQNPQTGEWYNPMAKGTGGSGSKAEDAEATDKQVKAIQSKAAMLFPDDVTDPVSGKPHASAEVLKQRADFAKEEFQKHEEAHEPQRPFTPGDKEGMSKRQIRQVENWHDKLKTVEQPRDDMTDAQRAQAIEGFHTLHVELGRYGSFDRPVRPITPEDKKKIEQAKMATANITKDRPTPEPLKDQKPFSPGDDKSMTGEQRGLVNQLQEGIKTLAARPDLPMPVKIAGEEAAHGMHALLGKYGWVVNPKSGEVNPKMDKTDRERYTTYGKVLASIPPPPPAVSGPGAGKTAQAVAENIRQRQADTGYTYPLNSMPGLIERPFKFIGGAIKKAAGNTQPSEPE